MAAGISPARMGCRTTVEITLIISSAIAACDAVAGPHLILIGFLAIGPYCALLTGRWALTITASCYALALGTFLGVPDHIFGTTHPVRAPRHCGRRRCRGYRHHHHPPAPAPVSRAVSWPRDPAPSASPPTTAEWTPTPAV